MRGKLNKLADRGWLRKLPDGRFATLMKRGRGRNRKREAKLQCGDALRADHHPPTSVSDMGRSFR